MSTRSQTDPTTTRPAWLSRAYVAQTIASVWALQDPTTVAGVDLPAGLPLHLIVGVTGVVLLVTHVVWWIRPVVAGSR